MLSPGDEDGARTGKTPARPAKANPVSNDVEALVEIDSGVHLPSETDFARNRAESNREIGLRARALVSTVIAGGPPPNPETLLRLGVEGRAYFFKKLNEALTDLPAPVKTAIPVLQNRVAATSATTKPILKLDRNWVDQQHLRAPYYQRVAIEVLVVSLALVVLVVSILYSTNDGDLVSNLNSFINGIYK